jgi:hypothetical protein
MKILDIITPHETLDEGKVTDALKGAFDKLVSEPIGIFFGKRPPKKIIADWIDELLVGSEPGQQFKRNSELKAAESKLVSVLENSPFQDKADAKKVEALADSLVEYMFRTGKTSLPEGNTLKTLYTLVEQGAAEVPKSYGSKAEFLADEFITKEIRGRVVMPGDDRFLTDGNVGKYVRQLADSKVSVVWEAEKIVNPKPSGFDKVVGKIAEVLKQNKILKSEFNPLKLANIKRGFFLFELDKIFQPYLEQTKLADQWHESKKDMPPTVADRFPPVPPDLAQGSHISSKGTTPSYTYSTEDERYEMAYNWTMLHLRGAVAAQLLTWMTASWASRVLINKSGTFGKWTWSKIVFNNIQYLQKNPHVDQALKAYMGTMSQYSRLLFVDYLTTASNGSPRSDSLGKQLQRLAFDERQPIREYPEIQNLPEAMAAMTVDSIFELHNPLYTFMGDVMIEAGIPFTIHYVAVKELAVWAVETITPPVMKMIDKLVTPAETQVVPGVPSTTRQRTNAPAVVPPVTSDTDANSQATSTEPAATNSAEVVPPAPPASAPVTPKAKTKDKNPDASIYDVNESLKRKVALRLRS